MARPLNILVVEDNCDCADLLRRLLQHDGYRVKVAQTVAAALSAAGDGSVDLLVSDLTFPDGSGLDLMRKLRACGPIAGIALTGHAGDEYAAASREAGFALYLEKPISLDDLEHAIEQVRQG